LETFAQNVFLCPISIRLLNRFVFWNRLPMYKNRFETGFRLGWCPVHFQCDTVFVQCWHGRMAVLSLLVVQLSPAATLEGLISTHLRRWETGGDSCHCSATAVVAESGRLRAATSKQWPSHIWCSGVAGSMAEEEEREHQLAICRYGQCACYVTNWLTRVARAAWVKSVVSPPAY